MCRAEFDEILLFKIRRKLVLRAFHHQALLVLRIVIEDDSQLREEKKITFKVLHSRFSPLRIAAIFLPDLNLRKKIFDLISSVFVLSNKTFFFTV